MAKRKLTGKIGAALTIATAVVELVDNALPVTDSIIDKVVSSDGEDDIYTNVPELYKEGFKLDIEQAKTMLEEVDLKYMLVPLNTNDANVEYKDYIINQVIATNPKSGQRVKRGTMICVKYIPEDVITESKKIFDNSVKEKEELKIQKQAKREELTEKTKESVSKLADSAVSKTKELFKHNKGKQ